MEVNGRPQRHMEGVVGYRRGFAHGGSGVSEKKRKCTRTSRRLDL